MWASDKKKYLNIREQVDSVEKAMLHLSLLEAYLREKADLTAGSLVTMDKVFSEVQAAKYTSALSSWIHPDRAALASIANTLKTAWAELDTIPASKKAWLDDALKREQLRARVYLKADQHVLNYRI